MESVSYRGVDGSVWPLTEWSHRGVFLKEGALALAPGEEEGAGLSGGLSLVVADNAPDGAELVEIDETMQAWRRAWSPRLYGSLVVVGADEAAETWARVRLAAPIPDLTVIGPEGFEEFEQQVVAESRRWLRTEVLPGPEVTVFNAGDWEVWPRVRWQAGGVLVLPSGARVSLPTVPAPRTIWLDPGLGCVVVDDDGERDVDLWRALRGEVFPEVVPPGEGRVFRVPASAVVSWDWEVDDPL